MKTLHPNSKEAIRWRKAYDRANKRGWFCLEQVYKTYSREKYIAYKRCQDAMVKEHGANFRIVSYNSMQFTAGWTTFEGIRIETKSNSYLIPW